MQLDLHPTSHIYLMISRWGGEDSKSTLRNCQYISSCDLVQSYLGAWIRLLLWSIAVTLVLLIGLIAPLVSVIGYLSTGVVLDDDVGFTILFIEVFIVGIMTATYVVVTISNAVGPAVKLWYSDLSEAREQKKYAQENERMRLLASGHDVPTKMTMGTMVSSLRGKMCVKIRIHHE